MLAEADFFGEAPADERDALAVAARVRILGVDGADHRVQQAHHQAAHVLVEHRVLEVDRALVGDRVQQLAVDRVELAAGLVEPEHAAEHLVLALERHRDELARVLGEPRERLVLREMVDQQRTLAQAQHVHQLVGEAMDLAVRQA